MIRINEKARCLRSRYHRAIVYLRSKGLCYYCGKDLDQNWQCDHYLPWSKGGKNRRVWTCVKRCCGLRPNQQLSNLAGIENFQSIVEKGKLIKSEVLKISENPDFDYVKFLAKVA